MEKKVIRIGSVGVGAIWTGVHEPGIRRSPISSLWQSATSTREKLRAVGEKVRHRRGAPVYGLPRPDSLPGRGRCGHLHVE